MPRAGQGPHLQLFGPDSKHGAKAKRGFTRYVWYICYREGGRKRETSTGYERGDVELAQATLAQFLTRHRPADTGISDPGQMTVFQALDLYSAGHAPSAANPQRIGYAVKALVGSFLADLPLLQVTAAIRRKYQRERCRVTMRSDGSQLRTPLAAGTVIRELATLDAAARWCVQEGYLSHYPEDRWFPDRPPPKERYLTRKEAAKLLRAARRKPDHEGAPTACTYLPTFIMLGLYTGRRRESLLTLQWKPNDSGGWVDLAKGYIHFDPVGRRRTKKRRGTIRLPKRLLLHLRYIRRRTITHVIEHEGQPVGSVKRSFATACRAAGITDVTPHTMRHTVATWLAQQSVPTREAADYLDMTTDTYERIYRKYHPDHQAGALAALDRRRL